MQGAQLTTKQAVGQQPAFLVPVTPPGRIHLDVVARKMRRLKSAFVWKIKECERGGSERRGGKESDRNTSIHSFN